ncbi:MAG: sensor histidine kinase [Natronosporangium sp.]
MEPWERWKRVWQHAFFALALGLVTLGSVVGAGPDPAAVAIRVGLAAALAGWYGYWFVLAGSRGGAGPSHLPYLLGAAGLWAVMAAVDPALLAVGVAIFIPYCLQRPLWGVIAFVGLGAVWLAQAMVQDTLTWSTALACVVGVVVLGTIHGYLATLDHEGRKRQWLLDRLAAAQAGLATAERRAGRLAERQRLARDIHDTLTQGFASIAMLLDAATADLPPGAPATRRIEQAMRTARENLAESRRLVHALRPQQLDRAGLPDAVRLLADRLADETGVAVETVVTGGPVPLDPATESELVRVVQEALTNIRRHANATEVTVTLSYLDDDVLIDVQDNGSGFAPALPASGVGLGSMRERVDSLGGRLTVETEPGEGTTIALTVPGSRDRPGAGP